MVAGTAQTFCIFGSWRIGKDTGQRFNFCGGLLYLFQAHLKHCRTLMSQPSPGRRGLLGFAGSPPLVNFDRTHPSPSPACAALAKSAASYLPDTFDHMPHIAGADRIKRHPGSFQ